MGGCGSNARSDACCWTARRSRRSTARGQFDEVLGLSEHLTDALWRVDSAGARPVDATGGVIVAGMGGSASGGAARRRRARSAAAAPDVGLRRLRAAGLGGSLDPGLRDELLGQHRGDARGVRRGRRAVRAAARRARPAAGWPSALARRACRWFRSPEASSRVPRSATRSWSRSRRPLWPAPRRSCATRSRPPRRWPRSWPPSGAPTGPRTARPSRSPARCTGRFP